MIKLLFGSGRRQAVDPEALDRQTAEIQAYLDKEGPRMSFVANWLEHRKGQNGLGEDFDITFYPKGA